MSISSNCFSISFRIPDFSISSSIFNLLFLTCSLRRTIGRTSGFTLILLSVIIL